MRKARDLVKSVPRSFSTARTPTPAQMDPSDRYCYNPVLRWNPQVEAYFSKAYGPHHFSRISQALARPSCYSCIRVNTLKSTSDAVIEKLLAIIQETELGNTVDGMHLSESNAAAKIDMGRNLKSSLREYNNHLNLDEQKKVAFGNFEQLDSQKKSLETGSISKCQLPGLDYVVFVRGSGPHTIEYGYEIDRPPKEVIVSRKCAEAVLRGAQVYVPGVLACSSHVEKGDVVAVSVAVEQPGTDGGWGVGITRGTVLQGQQTDPYHFERNALYIGQGATMMSRAGIFRASGGIAVDMNNRVFKLPSFHDVLEGEIFLQNLPSIVTAHALDPQQDERILDMCAAPGGKTTAIAILMKDQGEVIAVDRSHNKVMDIQKLAAEMGLHCITTYKLDALKAVCRSNESNDMTTPSCRRDAEGVTLQSSDSPRLQMEKNQCSTEAFAVDFACQENVINGEGNQITYTSKADIRKNIRRMRNGPGRNQGMGGRVEKSKGFSPNSFDRVLLDAPCSALGLRPRLFAGEETIESLRNHAKYQRRMFDQAVQLVRPGGVIVYSTLVCNLMKSVYHAFEKTQKLFKKRKNLLPQTIAIIICGGDLLFIYVISSMLTFISDLCYTLIIYWLQLIYTYVYLSMIPFIFNFSPVTTTETLYFTEMRLRSKFP